MSSVPITDASWTMVTWTVAGALTWSSASWRPTPAMNVASDVRWPAMRLEAIDTLSAALFSAWIRVLAAASMSGTTAMVMPATRITAANFSEDAAPPQMPLNHRAPRIGCPSARSTNQDEGHHRDRGDDKDRREGDEISRPQTLAARDHRPDHGNCERRRRKHRWPRAGSRGRPRGRVRGWRRRPPRRPLLAWSGDRGLARPGWWHRRRRCRGRDRLRR